MTQSNVNVNNYNWIGLANTYHEFPQPETLNRRVKKLVQVIGKYEQDNNQFDFDNVAQSDEDDKSWTT